MSDTYDDMVRLQNELARQTDPVDAGSLQRLLTGQPETVTKVEALGRRIVVAKADVRDLVVADAETITFGRSWELTAQHWQDIDVNLTGVFNTDRHQRCRAVPRQWRGAVRHRGHLPRRYPSEREMTRKP
ncbi:hypothetical protein [Rhodococcus xishaensis]|uniref:hypothetical protein n=1 Tax=Rhodococcus xishaensis TaxID=2487364 RepID=UPI0038B5AA46